MNNFHKALIFFFGFVSFDLFQVSIASIVSTGDFNEDFFVIWSPTHVNTSSDGKTRSLKLDQESGKLYIYHDFKLRLQLRNKPLYCRRMRTNMAGTP